MGLQLAPEQQETLALGSSERAGDRIGRYKLLQPIGEGGCGVVYLAEQEEPVRRRVALKVIKLGMDTKQVVARFEAERQALALMDHPNIAKVLDGGATEAGRPFFVMELVKGVKITDYCDDHNLSTVGRLELFMQVCRAIQHAHQKGLIHRDIKPSNILVTLQEGVPVPKVIDFGIAKATTDQRLTDKTLFTALEQFIGTPAYMSPEQVERSGLDIDTRSDIYSLGVLLYELLTGKTPFDATELLEAGLETMRRTIREKEPVRPSTRLSTMMAGELTTTARRRQCEAPKLIAQVRGDLDWIVMKCLEKERARRYETANGLAMDIQRFLSDDPVVARPPSRIYQFRKLVRRNKVVFAAGTAVLAALVTGLGLSLWEFFEKSKAYQRTVRAEKTAQAEAIKSREAAELSQQMARKLRLNSYATDMKVVQVALEENTRGRALQLLRKYLPAPGEDELRGVEWRYLWKRAQGDELYTFRGHEGIVNSLAISPAGTLVASGSFDGTVKIWDPDSKRLVTNLQGFIENDTVTPFFAFSPDGSKFAAVQKDGVTLWETGTWKSWKRLEGASPPLAFTPDGKILAVMSGNDVEAPGAPLNITHRTGSVHKGPGRFIHLWDTRTWKYESIETGFWFESDTLVFSPDSRILLGCGREENVIQLWELATMTKVKELEFHNPSSLAVSPDGSWLAAGNWQGDLSIWDLTNGNQKVNFRAHQTGIFGMAFAPDSQMLATAGCDQLIHLWNPSTHERLSSLGGHLNEVWRVKFLPGGRRLASASKDGTVKLWDLTSKANDDQLPGEPLEVQLFDFRYSRNLLVSFNGARIGPRALQLWEVANGRAIKTFAVDRDSQHPTWRWFCGAQDGKVLALGMATEGAIQLYDRATGKLIRKLHVAEDGCYAVALSPDEQRLVVARLADGTASLWNLKTESREADLPGFYFDTGGEMATFSPNGRSLAFQSTNYIVKLWDVAKKRETFVLQGHRWKIWGLVFSPDSKLLATSSWDNDARLWEVATGSQFGPTLIAHQRGVASVSFSPDGKTLVTGGTDNTARFWHVATGQEMLTIRDLPDARLSADGSALIINHPDRPSRLIRIPTTAEIDVVEKGQR
jgi:WD40 repeat protein/serine/threonine protein kinase